MRIIALAALACGLVLGCGDDSERAFTTITVLSPNGSETWYYEGRDVDIMWSTDGGSGSVDLHYSIDDGGAWTEIALGVPNTGFYTWQVPLADSTLCLVRARLSGSTTVEDVSDGTFSMLALPAGMIAHWKLDETTGTDVNDSSGNGNLAALVGPTFSAAATEGQIGGAVTLGETDYIEAFSTNSLASPVTISLWMNMALVKGGALATGYNAGHANRWDLELRWDHALYWSEHAGSLYSGGTIVPSAARWYHVAAVHDLPNTMVAVYLDGEVEASGPISRDLQTDTTLRFGIGGIETAFSGMMDDIRVYGRVLTQPEIQALHDAGVQQ